MHAFSLNLILSVLVAVSMALPSHASDIGICLDFYKPSIPPSAQVPAVAPGEGVLVTRIEPFEPPQVKMQASSVKELTEVAAREIETRLSGVVKNIVPQAKGTVFAFNFATAGTEVVSRGASKSAHDKIIAELHSRNVFGVFASIPAKLRNKYFEIDFGKEGKEVSVELKFAWELPIKFRSQLLTGFGETKTGVITPYQEGFGPEAIVRSDLIESGISQETGATCGIGSVCQVMHVRRIPVNEWQLLERANQYKNEFDVVGLKDPGLSIYELVDLMKDFRKANNLNFRVETEIVRDEAGLDKFRELVRQASTEGSNVDLIVNLWSPTIGRAGTGHFLPVAGYNPKTDYVLMSETNLAFNKLYWVHLPTLYKSVTSDANVERGYLVIR